MGRAQVRVELRAPRVGDAMDRPEAAVLREMRGRLGVPVLGEDDEAAGDGRHRDLAVDRRDDRVAAGDGQAARRIGEVVLDVDDDQGRGRVIALHRPSVSARGRRRRAARPIGRSSPGTWPMEPVAADRHGRRLRRRRPISGPIGGVSIRPGVDRATGRARSASPMAGREEAAPVAPLRTGSDLPDHRGALVRTGSGATVSGATGGSTSSR